MILTKKTREKYKELTEFFFFVDEALERKSELEGLEVKPYIKEILTKLPEILGQRDKKKLAEDALTYSVIFQNYALKI